MLVCFFPMKRLRTKYNVSNAMKLTPSVISREAVDQALCTRMNWTVPTNKALLINLLFAVSKLKVLLNRARATLTRRGQLNLDINTIEKSAVSPNIENQILQLSPEDCAEEARAQRILEGKHLLHQRLSFRRLEIVDIPSDGNCQFRALSFELFGSEEHHLKIRTVAVAWLAEHGATYSGFIGDEADWWAYLGRMRDPGEWGDELTLRAVSDAYGVIVHLVTSERDYFNILYEPKEARPPHRHVFLAYVAPVHYNAVQLKY